MGIVDLLLVNFHGYNEMSDAITYVRTNTVLRDVSKITLH